MGLFEQIQLLGLLAGLAVLTVSAGLALRAQRVRLETRLGVFFSTRQGRAAAQPTRPAPRRPFLGWARLGVESRQLARAGWSMSPRRFLLLQLLAGLLGLAVANLVGLRLELRGPAILPVLAGGLVAGLALPRLGLALAQRRRLSLIEKHFAAALEALANGIQGGLSLPQSLGAVSRDLPPPLGAELILVTREMGMGLGLEEALDHLAERVPLKDVEIFVAAIHIQYRTGGNLSDLLRGLAFTIRERLRIRGDLRTLTAQGKLSAYIVTLLPVGITLVIKFINPAYFEQIVAPGVMRLLLIGAIVGVVSGFYALMRIADVEV